MFLQEGSSDRLVKSVKSLVSSSNLGVLPAVKLWSERAKKPSTLRRRPSIRWLMTARRIHEFVLSFWSVCVCWILFHVSPHPAAIMDLMELWLGLLKMAWV